MSFKRIAQKSLYLKKLKDIYLISYFCLLVFFYYCNIIVFSLFRNKRFHQNTSQFGIIWDTKRKPIFFLHEMKNIYLNFCVGFCTMKVFVEPQPLNSEECFTATYYIYLLSSLLSIRDSKWPSCRKKGMAQKYFNFRITSGWQKQNTSCHWSCQY